MLEPDTELEPKLYARLGRVGRTATTLTGLTVQELSFFWAAVQELELS